MSKTNRWVVADNDYHNDDLDTEAHYPNDICDDETCEICYEMDGEDDE